MKKILLLLVVVLAAGGYWYYRSFAAGPTYALLQAAKAAKTHDVAEFERYVDVRSVAGSLVDQLAGQGAALGIATENMPDITGLLGLMKPQITKAAQQEVQRYIETGSLGAAAQPGQMPGISLAGLASKVASPQSKLQGVQYVRETGNEARVGLEFTQPQYDTTMVLELKMLNQGDYWQVTEITNIGDLLKQIARLDQQRHRTQ